MEAVIFRESSIAEENCDLRSRNVHRALSQFLSFGDSDEVRGLHVVLDENGFADHVMYCSLVICRFCLDAFSIFIFSQLVLGNRFLLKDLVLPLGACHSVFSSREILLELEKKYHELPAQARSSRKRRRGRGSLFFSDSSSRGAATMVHSAACLTSGLKAIKVDQSCTSSAGALEAA